MKKVITGILIGAMALCFAACNDVTPEDSLIYDTKVSSVSSTISSVSESTSSETESSSSLPQVQPEKPIAPSSWEYPAIDLSEGKYKSEKIDFDACARSFGYRSGTYEYEYFRALSGISFYARIASNHVSNAMKNYTVSDLAEGLYKMLSRETFIAPYENILFHTFSLLKSSDFTLFPDDDTLITQYQNTLPYLLDKPVEIWYPSALSFTDIDTKLAEYALELLHLEEKYPDYMGEFKLSAEAISQAQAIVDSCKVVDDNRSAQWAAWEEYFKEATPKVTATAEVIPEKDTVKLIFTSNHALSVQIDPKYISDFKGEVTQNGNAVGYHYDPMESPVVCYVPIGLFYSTHGEFSVTKYVTDDSFRAYKETVTVSLDLSAYFSDDPIMVNDPFLDAVLKAEFGGSYNERDLSEIREITISYRRTKKESVGGMSLTIEPTVSMYYYDRERGNGKDGFSHHAYSNYFAEDWTGDFPLGVLDDMKYFPLLENATFKQDGSAEMTLPEGYLDSILSKQYTADDFP